MKKLLALCAVALMLNASAATINWGFGGDVYLMKNGDDYTSAVLAQNFTGTVPTSAYLALVYVGSNASTFDIASIDESSVVASTPYSISPGEGYCDFNPYSVKTTITAAKYSDGDSFAVVWFTGSKFDYIYDVADGTAFNQAETVSDIARGNITIDQAGTSSAYGGVVAVPEPSTAALALAGLALLLKRRKA